MSVNFLLSHFNNSAQSGHEEIQFLAVETNKNETLTESTQFEWATGSKSGYSESLPGATNFNPKTRIISASINTCCESGSGRISISNKTPFSKVVLRHQDLGTNPIANGIILSELMFCVYVPPVPVVKKDSSRQVIEKVIPPIEEKIITHPIYFDFDKAVIRKDAMEELDKFLLIYKKSSTLKLEINSFSDCRGSSSYNAILSDKRAEAVMQYLISKGIPASQIIKKGLGESTSKTCDCEIKESSCPEKEYESNRRTEIKVVNL